MFAYSVKISIELPKRTNKIKKHIIHSYNKFWSSYNILLQLFLTCLQNLTNILVFIWDKKSLLTFFHFGFLIDYFSFLVVFTSRSFLLFQICFLSKTVSHLNKRKGIDTISNFHCKVYCFFIFSKKAKKFLKMLVYLVALKAFESVFNLSEVLLHFLSLSLE